MLTPFKSGREAYGVTIAHVPFTHGIRMHWSCALSGRDELALVTFLSFGWIWHLVSMQDERMRLGEQLAGVREELRRAEQANRAKLETQSQVGPSEQCIIDNMVGF